VTGRNLPTLLERASDAVPELDFAEQAWARAVAEQHHRRRVVVGSVGALAAAVLAVSAVRSADRNELPPPVPSPTTTGEQLLPDHTAYALMPLEGTE
jgi:hypothetical protein